MEISTVLCDLSVPAPHRVTIDGKFAFLKRLSTRDYSDM